MLESWRGGKIQALIMNVKCEGLSMDRLTGLQSNWSVHVTLLRLWCFVMILLEFFSSEEVL